MHLDMKHACVCTIYQMLVRTLLRLYIQILLINDYDVIFQTLHNFAQTCFIYKWCSKSQIYISSLLIPENVYKLAGLQNFTNTLKSSKNQQNKAFSTVGVAY